MRNALHNASRLGVLITTFVKNEVAPMGKFAIHGFWKHPVAAVMALAAVSYFGFIFTALAGKPTPATGFPGRASFDWDWCFFASSVPWCP